MNTNKNIKNLILNNIISRKDLFALGIIGYSISAIFNDSILAISPIIYISAGICISSTLKNNDGERI